MNTHSTASNGDEGAVGDVAGLPALIPFSGAISPSEVRQLMVGLNLNGPPMAIWRKTTIAHSTPDGSFSLYACERTGQAMWVPSGEHFVADRPRGVQPRGTVMDYLAFRGNQTGRPSGYGLQRVSQVPSPRRHLTNVVRHRPLAAATGPRYSPMAAAPAGTGTRRTVRRRERRQKCQEEISPQTPPAPATSTTAPPPSVSNSASKGPAVPPTPSTPPSTPAPPSIPAPPPPPKPKNRSVVYYNSQRQMADKKAYRVAELNLPDSDADIS